MNNKQQDYQPVLATNPHTGEVVDIKPFFDLLNWLDESKTEIEIGCAVFYTERICRMISTGIDQEFIEHKLKEFQSNLMFLFKMQDMFKSLTVFKKGGQK